MTLPPGLRIVQPIDQNKHIAGEGLRASERAGRSMRLRAGLTVVLVLVAGAFAAAIAVLPQTARAATLYVGGPGPGNYTTIGAAVTAANPGDTVFVFAGTYPETVTIGKSISLVGENRDTTIIDGGEVYVGGASWANVTGFHLRGRGGPAGVYVWLGRNCRFEGNSISNYTVGILLNSSSSITLENNVMTGNGIFIQGEEGGGNAPEHWASHTIGVSNTVNGKPVYYWSNVAGGTIPAGAGEVLLGNVTGVTVQGQTLWNASTGVEAGFSSGLKILGNTVSANMGEGISLYHSPANEISGNDVSRGEIGVVLWLSDGNTVANNNLSRNLIGIWIVASSRSIVRNNTLSANNGSGIGFVPPGTDNQVANNTATGNTFGIYTLGMGGVGMTGNVLSNNMHGILGGNGDTILENTAFSNTVNGIEVEGPNNVIASNHVYGNPEGIRVYNAGGNVIAGNNASGNGAGILLGSLTSGNTVLNNTAMNNDYGIEVGALSNGDAITRNNVTGSRIEGISIIQSTGTIVSENRIANNTLGVHLYRSSGTRVYHNTILGNSQQAYDELSGGNQWDDGYPSGGNR